MILRKKISFWKSVLFIGLFLISAINWLGYFSGYRATHAVLLSEQGACVLNGDAARTIAGMRDTEQFQKRTLGSTRLTESQVYQDIGGETGAIALLKTVKVQAGKEGALVRLDMETVDQESADIILRESTETLLRMSRVYLGPDIKFVELDAPLLQKTILHPVYYVVTVLLTSLVLFFLVIGLSFVFGRVREKWQSRSSDWTPTVVPEEKDQRFVPQKLDPSFLYQDAFSEEEKVAGEPIEAVLVEPIEKAEDKIHKELFGKPQSSGLQSVSVTMDDLPFRFEGESDSTPGVIHPIATNAPQEVMQPEVIEEIHVEEKPVAEPTMDDYKKRLNALLRKK